MPLPILLLRKRKLRHSLGRPSRSDFVQLEIEAFIYIGGNDSMDTIKKLSDYAIVTGQPTRFVGCPKTIDNDLALTDHTPGYGSAAKYIGTSVKEIIRDGFCLLLEENYYSR